MTDGVVKIHGREYQTVALRIKNFWELTNRSGWAARTTIIQSDENCVIMRAEIWHDNFLVATGHAEEKRGSSKINKTSALENAETSAIGRALATFGLGGTEFRSADELQNALHQQEGVDFIPKKQVDEINHMIAFTNSDVDAFLQFAGAETVDTITTDKMSAIESVFKAKLAKMEREPGSDG